MKEYNLLLINVDELWLKGKNRHVYFKKLKQHIKLVFKVYGPNNTLIRENQRFVASTEDSFSRELIKRLAKIPGIHSIVPACKTPVDLELLAKMISEDLQSLDSKPQTFKIVTKRTNKQFRLNSQDISCEVGHLVLEQNNSIKVNVHNPDIFVNVKVLKECIYYSLEKIMATGGLPWNTSGHLLSLLSGGFDSPIASYLMGRRGCKVTQVFFHAYPFVGDEVKEKVVALSHELAAYQKHMELWIIPFGDIQTHIADHCKDEYRTLLFRYFMLKTSARLAEEVRAQALVTGDSLGQVSSQTIGNISLLESTIKTPVFRPLMGFTKNEIIQWSRTIGTHDISIVPHDDACSLFSPRHPVIKPDIEYFKNYIASHPCDQLIEDAIKNAEVKSWQVGKVHREDGSPFENND